jgi:hypothetical protein
MPRKGLYYVIPAYGVDPFYEGGHRTRAAAKKELAQVVREEVAECRARHGRCSTVGTVREGDVEIKIGGKQGYHTWQRWLITQK